VKVIRISFDQFLILLLLLSVTCIPFIAIGFNSLAALGAFFSSQIILLLVGIFYFIVGAIRLLKNILFKRIFKKDRIKEDFKKSAKCFLCIGIYWILHYTIITIIAVMEVL